MILGILKLIYNDFWKSRDNFMIVFGIRYYFWPRLWSWLDIGMTLFSIPTSIWTFILLSIWLLFPSSIWTFILLFLYDFYSLLLFGLVFPFSNWNFSPFLSGVFFYLLNLDYYFPFFSTSFDIFQLLFISVKSFSIIFQFFLVSFWISSKFLWYFFEF